MKTKFLAFIIIISASLCLLAQTQGTGETNPIQNKKGTTEPKLLWSDEFNGTGIPDPAKWDRPEYNRRNNVNGPDGYWSGDDSYLDGNGNLVIRVRKIDDKNNDGDPYDYSVGAIRTKGKFEQLYGRFEIRCQLPKQQGWWVAFWMMQGNQGSVGNGGIDGSEVDIMEAWGWTDKINHAIHWDGYGADHKSTGKNEKITGIREGFHTYALEWYPEMYVFFVDSIETWRTKGGGVCNQPGYIKITGEISTEDWAINNYWSNDPKAATYPDYFIVDYVRFYELGDYVDPLSVSTKPANKNLQIHPNPVKDWLTIDMPTNVSKSGNRDVVIINSVGQVAKSLTLKNNTSELSVSDLNQGLYVLLVKSDATSMYQKFIKN